MRHFRHLTKSEISDIITSHTDGVTQAVLAQRFGVDHSTISYHVRKYERSYPEEGGVYAAIKSRVRKVCIHPSGRCTLCGAMWDELHRKERDLIESLGRRLNAAHSTLRSAGFDVESEPYTGRDDTH